MMAAVAIAAYILLIIHFARVDARAAAEQPEDEPPVYDITTTAEQAAFVAEQVRELETLEGLLTDLQTASPDLIRVLRLSWLDAGGEHEHEIFMDGSTCTEYMIAIIERETQQQRSSCAMHCQALASRTRRVRNGAQNDV